MHPRQRLCRHGLRVLLRAGHRRDGDSGGSRDEHVPRLERPSLRRHGPVRRHPQPRLHLARRTFHPARGAGRPGRHRRREHRQRAAGIACPPTCIAPFPYGTVVTLIAGPDPAAPFLAWKFGCTPATDPRRCVLTATNRPNWVGVALGEDAEIGQPTNLAVLFDVSRQGQGRVTGRELNCGGDLRAPVRLRLPGGAARRLPPPGGASRRGTAPAPRTPMCRLYVGPVTSVAARFTENLAPQLQSVQVTGTKAGRKLRVRLSVRHAAQARLLLRREGAQKLLAERRYQLAGGVTTLVLAVPAKTKPGRLRLTISVTDGMGGGRTYTRVLKVGGLDPKPGSASSPERRAFVNGPSNAPESGGAFAPGSASSRRRSRLSAESPPRSPRSSGSSSSSSRACGRRDTGRGLRDLLEAHRRAAGHVRAVPGPGRDPP